MDQYNTKYKGIPLQGAPHQKAYRVCLQSLLPSSSFNNCEAAQLHECHDLQGTGPREFRASTSSDLLVSTRT
eukprot:1162153-Pelagomonas_calceolata.AAC.5